MKKIIVCFLCVFLTHVGFSRAKKHKRKSNRKKSYNYFSIGVESGFPNFLSLNLRYKMNRRFILKAYATPPLTFSQEQKIKSDKIFKKDILFLTLKLKNKESTMNLEPQLGPNFGFDLMYRVSRYFFIESGILYRSLSLHGDSTLDLFFEVNNNSIDLPISSYPSVKVDFKDLSVKAAVLWERKFFKNKLFFSVAGGALFSAYRAETYESEILLKAKLEYETQDLTDLFETNISSKEESVEQDLKDKLSTFTGKILPYASLSFGYNL
ncbi:MAG: hypothetical protein CMP11_01160 [Zetaproteobacteria bacterium]|nr:hypothetical protein [Pseudobdellovibrionaceae bacterium]|tara:strand:+ start:635 stop:1435 length:801 start_codon:yes stop_codon:yes gene_type:complete